MVATPTSRITHRTVRMLATMLLLVLLALGAAACGEDSSESSSDSAAKDDTTEASDDGMVGVQLGEDDGTYFIDLEDDTIPAGETTFKIDNVGTMHHEFVIYRTDLAPDELPKGDDGKAKLDEASIVGEAVYAMPPRGDADHRIRDGRGVDYTVDLEPGTYVVLCNLAGHYAAGQYAQLTVEEPAEDDAAADDAADDEAAAPTEPARAEATVEGTPVNVKLGEQKGGYFVKVDKATVPAGTTTFVIDNVGTMHHEFIVYRTDLAPDKLPLGDDGTAALEEEEIIGEAVYTTPPRGDADHRIRDGRGVNYTLDLEPGTYVLLCNLPGHYAAKQYTAFTVT